MAVIFAASCAAAFVGLIPSPVPAAAAMQTIKPVVVAAKSETLNLGADPSHASCEHPWPYYEASCLHDPRRRNNDSTAVRMIILEKLAGNRIQTIQR